MNRRTSRAAIVAVVLSALVGATSALGKEGVEATLTSALPKRPAPGQEISIAWTLTYEERGKRRPFNGGGVFVHLEGASGRSTIGFARNVRYATGAYEADVVVPKDGIAGMSIGIRGTACGPSGCRAGDVLFPIVNNPVGKATRAAPGGEAPRRRPATARREQASATPFPSLPVALGVAAAIAVGAATVRLRRRPR